MTTRRRCRTLARSALRRCACPPRRTRACARRSARDAWSRRWSARSSPHRSCGSRSSTRLKGRRSRSSSPPDGGDIKPALLVVAVARVLVAQVEAERLRHLPPGRQAQSVYRQLLRRAPWRDARCGLPCVQPHRPSGFPGSALSALTRRPH